MKTIRTMKAMTAWSRQRHSEGETIGLVPTMGALHDAHRALIRTAKQVCDVVVVSIFVNPRQFGPTEDLDRYPRPLARDLRVCRQEGVNAVFLPTVSEMYPSEFDTAVVVQALTQRLEGMSRPGHLEGVATIVTKLFHIVQADKAVFGQKDYQQALVVTRLVRDLNVPTEIVLHPTVREPDGLALSSRNHFLSAGERKAATVLYQALLAGRDAVHRGERSAGKVRAAMMRVLAAEPYAHVDYATLADSTTLKELQRVRGRVVLLLAVWIGKTRLMDNLVVTP